MSDSHYLEQGQFDGNLRLGDIIEGFSYFMPEFEDFVNKKSEFRMDVKLVKYFGVLTPCCSIEDKVIILAPLKKLDGNLMKNPYYIENFTRINLPFQPQFSYPPEVWSDKFDDQKRSEIMLLEPSYQFSEKFVFDNNDKLEKYTLSHGKSNISIETNSYWVDFKDAFTISCNKIQRGNSYSKILQLTTSSRHELREKLAWFYSRVPDEDKIVS